MNYLECGPFSIPKKDKWLIIGSGPSAEFVDNFINDNKGIGIISLNSVLNKYPCDVNIHSHYESVMYSWNHLNDAGIIFLPDPIVVGYRCAPMDIINMFKFDDFDKFFPGKIRTYKKNINANFSIHLAGNLYAKHTIATAAVHLLHLNGVKEFYYSGIDGGIGYASQFKDIPIYTDTYRSPKQVDMIKQDFDYFNNMVKMNAVKVETQ